MEREEESRGGPAAAEAAPETFAREMEALRREIESLRAGLLDLRPASDKSERLSLPESKARLRQAAGGLEDLLRERFGETSEILLRRGQEIAGQARDFVQKRPLASVAAVSLAGLVLGQFLGLLAGRHNRR